MFKSNCEIDCPSIFSWLAENKRIKGMVVQTVKANLDPVTEEQIPYLKAAYSKNKPHLIYRDWLEMRGDM